MALSRFEPTKTNRYFVDLMKAQNLPSNLALSFHKIFQPRHNLVFIYGK